MAETEEEKKAREAAEAAARKAAEDAAKATPFASFPDAESFQKRVAREARAMLKEAGLAETDPAKLKLIVDEHAKVLASQAAAEEAKKSEIQRAAEAKAQAEAATAAAMSAKEQADMRAHLFKVFASEGVKNFDYAFFAVQSKLAGLKDGEELDEVAFVKGLMADKSQAAALGLIESVKVEGATTTEAGKQPEAKPGSPAADPKAPVDVFQQSATDFKAGVTAKYGFTPM
jgi:predicted NACHT family NTPase